VVVTAFKASNHGPVFQAHDHRGAIRLEQWEEFLKVDDTVLSFNVHFMLFRIECQIQLPWKTAERALRSWFEWMTAGKE